MAPLIRSTLVALYLALVVPLPVLASGALAAVMLAAVPLGLILILALVSEEVELDDRGIRVGHPAWCRWLLRRGWQLRWDQVSGLTPVATSQGGRVFYLRSREGDAYLLPQRVARFDAFLAELAGRSGLDLAGVGRISPAWTYQVLAILCWLLLAAELIGLATVMPAPMG